MKYVVIGSGVAGVSALKEIIQKSDEDAEIRLLTDETYGFYYRPRLIQCLSGEIGVEDIIINDVEWFEKNGVDLHLDEPATSIDFSDKIVHTEKGRYQYDKLLLANGAKPFVPPVKGTDLDNVFTLRIAEDAQRIYSTALESEKAVVVGGGLLGLESAYNLQKTGLEVTVLEVNEYLMSQQLDSIGGEILRRKLSDLGLTCQVRCVAREIAGEDRVEKVRLKSGREVEADFVLFSTGIRSNLEPVDNDVIETDRGIVVDERMRTSIEDVYAAGDVAQYDQRVYGIWGPSMEMGKIAGKNMLDEEASFSGYVPSFTLKVAEVNVTSLGVLEEGDGVYSEVLAEHENYCRVFKNRDDEPVGAIIVGDYEGESELVEKINP